MCIYFISLELLSHFWKYFFFTFWIYLQVQVIYDMCHFTHHPFLLVISGLRSLNVGVGFEEKAGWWRNNTAVIAMVILWYMKITCVHIEIPALIWKINMENIKLIVVYNIYTTVVCIFIGWFTSSSSSSPLLFLFHFIKTRLWYANYENRFPVSRMCRTWQRWVCGEEHRGNLRMYDNVPLKF